MQVLIVEDEELAVRKLKRLLALVRPEAKVVGELDSIESTVQWLNSSPSPDIILMDIELVDGQSFSVFERTTVKCPVIFITSYDEYAIQAFNVNSVSYLLKPVEEEDLKLALNKFDQVKAYYSTQSPLFSIDSLLEDLQSRLQPKNYKNRFLVKQGSKLVTLDVKEIAYFFSEDGLNFIRTQDNRKMIIDYTLEELKQSLNPSDFFLINRSYLISAKAIQKIESYFGQRLTLQLQPVSEKSVIISREKVTAFKEWIGK
jgi:two-component system, LytTR family, response regulator LytT